MASTNPTPTEHDECVTLAEYLELLYATGKIEAYTHLAQETFTKSWMTKNRNKAEGVRPGVPDYLIVLPKKILFIEMKRLKGSTISQAQKDWLQAINNTGKATARVCHGFDSAKEFINQQLEEL